MSPRRMLLSASLLLLGAAPLHARQVAVVDGRVRTLVEELDRRSPTAHRMLQAMRFGSVPVFIGTPAQMAADVTRLGREGDPGARGSVGLMAALFAPGGERLRVGEIFIALDLERVERIFGEARGEASDVPWDRIRRDELLAVLGHEFAHAYALVVRDGDIGGQCEDPPEDTDPALSCVVQAENVIRRELRIPLDWGYGMPAPRELAASYAAMADRASALEEIRRRTTESLRASAPGGTFQ